ncbi:MAG: hypothetical protein DRP45_08595, partial [Candidatus Zixiibacteriota bacterium]
MTPITPKLTKSANWLPLGITLGVILGAVLGYIIPDLLLATGFIGAWFINALMILVIPLIVAVMVTGIAALGDLRKTGRALVGVFAYFAATTAVAVLIGFVLVKLFSPDIEAPLFAGTSSVPSISEMLSSVVPAYLPNALAQGRYLGLILLALFTGGILAAMGTKGKTMVGFCKELHEVVLRLTGLILYVAPIGLFFLVGSSVAANRESLPELAGGLGMYALILVIGLAIHVGVVLPAALKIWTQRSPLEYFRHMTPAFLTALGTSSSAATLPVTYDCAVNKAKVDARAGSLVLPFGSLANLDGTAMHVMIATTMIAGFSGFSLGWLDLLWVAVLTIFVSFGAAGMPMASLVVLPVVLVYGAGLRPEVAVAGMASVAAVEWILDRLRTVTNVWGDAVGAAVIAESFELKAATRTRRDSRTGRVTRTRSKAPVRADSRTRRPTDRRTDTTRRTERRPSRTRSASSSPAARP